MSVVTSGHVQARSEGELHFVGSGRRKSRGIVFSALMLLSLLLPGQAALAQAPPPFSCDATLYLVLGGQLHAVDRSVNPFAYPTLGSSGLSFNAMGYNPADDYLYALRSSTGNEGRRLYRIGSDGARQDLGLVAGLPAPTGNAYFVGAFTEAGDNILYVMQALPTNQMYRINVSTMTTDVVTLSRAINIADFDYANGLLYGQESAAGQLISINPASGLVSNIGVPQGFNSIVGTIFADDNAIYGIMNSGGFYAFDPVTGARTLISASPAAASSDGARCPIAPPLTFDADLAITKDDGNTTYVAGTNVVYTIVVSNNGPFGARNAHVQDPLPAGISTASWTCTAAGGAVCRTASGSGAIDTFVDLPLGGTATFTLTMGVPAGFTGTLVNTATVTPGEGNSDPDPSNNSDDDIDNPPQADLSITKTNTPVAGPVDQDDDVLLSGSETTYTIVVSNHGPGSVAGALLTDTPTNLDCPAANAVTCMGAGCPAGPITVADLASGLVLGTLAATAPDNSVTLSFQCTVP